MEYARIIRIIAFIAIILPCFLLSIEIKLQLPETLTQKISLQFKKYIEQIEQIVEKISPATFVNEFDRFMEPERAIRYGGIAALSIGIPLTFFYGGRGVLNVLEKRIFHSKPAIINSEGHPKYGDLDRLSRWWTGYKTPSMIFDQSVRNHLVEIQEKTKNIRDHIRKGDKKATYANLRLSGSPGTGKSLFARVLADYADMDFLPTTAEALMRSSSGFDELVAMANNSKYGAIIFIDEADALFLNRNMLMKSTSPDALAQQKLLSHIMAMTGQRNNKYMIVIATNYAYVIDPAMSSRFPEKVEMPLPDAQARRALFNLYINDDLFDEKNNSKEFVAAARLLLTSEKISEMVAQTEGFSPRNISNMIQAMRDASRATKKDILTAEHINNAINRALRDYAAEKEDAIKYAQALVQSPVYLAVNLF